MKDTKENIVVIIPARGGSKRLPQKNTRLLNGLPLFAHSILYAKAMKNNAIDICVSTDDTTIKRIALDYGAKVIDRPIEISGDNSTTLSALQHAIEVVKKKYDLVVVLQPTNPLRPKHLLEEALDFFRTQNLKSLFTVSPLIEKLGTLKDNKFLPANYEVGQRSQDMEPLFYENGLLYIAKTELIADGQLITKDSFPFIVDHIYGTIDIDTEDDFLYAEFVMNKY